MKAHTGFRKVLERVVVRQNGKISIAFSCVRFLKLLGTAIPAFGARIVLWPIWLRSKNKYIVSSGGTLASLITAPTLILS